MILFHSTESFFVLRDHGSVSLGASHNSVKKKNVSTFRPIAILRLTIGRNVLIFIIFILSCVKQLGKRARGPEEQN